MPRSNMIVDYLQEHGPTPKPELPRKIMVTDKQRGVWIFRVHSSSAAPGDGSGGQITNIAWLPDYHDKVTVVKTFLEANPAQVEPKTRQGLRRVIHGQGRQWSSAIDEAFEELG